MEPVPDTACCDLLLNPYGIDLDPYHESELLDLVARILAELQTRRKAKTRAVRPLGQPYLAPLVHALIV